MILPCSKCSKVIDARPPACPACGATQPEPDDQGRVRLGWVTAALLASLAGGYLWGAQLQVYRVVSLRSAHIPQRPMEPPVQREMRARVRERVAALRADPKHPYAELEDLLLDPAFRGKPASTVAYLFSVKTPGALSGRLSVGWGHGAMLNIDLGALDLETRTAAVGLTQNPHFVVARGTLASEPGEPLFRLERLEDLGQSHTVTTVPNLLEDR